MAALAGVLRQVGRKAKPIVTTASRAARSRGTTEKFDTAGFNDLVVAAAECAFSANREFVEIPPSDRKRGPPPRRCSTIRCWKVGEDRSRVYRAECGC